MTDYKRLYAGVSHETREHARSECRELLEAGMSRDQAAEMAHEATLAWILEQIPRLAMVELVLDREIERLEHEMSQRGQTPFDPIAEFERRWGITWPPKDAWILEHLAELEKEAPIGAKLFLERLNHDQHQ